MLLHVIIIFGKHVVIGRENV